MSALRNAFLFFFYYLLIITAHTKTTKWAIILVIDNYTVWCVCWSIHNKDANGWSSNWPVKSVLQLNKYEYNCATKKKGGGMSHTDTKMRYVTTAITVLLCGLQLNLFVCQTPALHAFCMTSSVCVMRSYDVKFFSPLSHLNLSTLSLYN